MTTKKAINTKLFKVDTALGIHHAKASRKNLFLMTISFALSIILFLSFSVTIEFMNHTLTPLRPWTEIYISKVQVTPVQLIILLWGIYRIILL